VQASAVVAKFDSQAVRIPKLAPPKGIRNSLPGQMKPSENSFWNPS
jgi:hypothetical protein